MLLQNEKVAEKENLEQRNKGFNSGKAERWVLGGWMDRIPRLQPVEIGEEEKMVSGGEASLEKR